MGTPLKYLLNPCDFERLPVLAPVGDALASLYAAFTANTDCPCCLGGRLVGVAVAGVATGALLSLLWS